ncbi:MAG TPA: DUF6318 family protein, partial [Cellulomonas sp.]
MPRSLFVPDAASSRPVGVALAVALAVGLLGGCSFGGTDSSAPSTSAGPTVPASPTPTAAATPSPTTTPKPERPAAMDTVNLDGAIATATYFLELQPYVANTGDLAEWRAMSHDDCVFCSGVANEVSRMFTLGHRQEGTDTMILSATGVEVNPGVYFQVNVELTQGPATEVDRS